MAGDGTIGKACDVLEQVAAFGRPVRFGELLDGSSFPKASLYRFLQSLTNQGMLCYDPDRQTYAPGLRLVRLAHSAWTQSSLAPVARPILDMLSLETGETVHLAQLDASQVLYVDKRNARKPVEMYSEAGKVGPALLYRGGQGDVGPSGRKQPAKGDFPAKLSPIHRPDAGQPGRVDGGFRSHPRARLCGR